MRFYRPFLTAVLLGLGLTLAAAKPIRVGVEIDSAPLSFVDAKGKRTGFTIELWEEMARASGLDIEVVPNYWTQHLRDFHAGEIDVLANVIKTAERLPVMDFSIGHAKVHGVVYQRHDQSPLRLTKGFAGKRIGTLDGTIARYNARIHGGWGAEIIGFNSWQAPLDATHRGEIDGTLMLSPVSSRIANTHNLRIVLVDDIIHQYHFAVRKGEAELLAQLNEALATVRHNGTFDRLFAKWIGPIEPRTLRFTDLRPYLLPAAAGLFAVLLVMWWQRHMLSRVARQAEALRVSEERWKFAIESSGDGVWDWDAASGRVLRSLRWKEMLGYSPTEIGDQLEDWHRLIHPDDVATVLAAQEAHHAGLTAAFTIEHRMRCRDGSWKWILNRGKVVKRDADGQPLRVIGTHTDLTDRKQAEEDRLVLSKLESTGILAGGIAHDFNNLLAVIVLNLDLAQLTGGAGAAVNQRLNEAKKATLAAQHLTQQLITFARGGSNVRQATDLCLVVRESAQLALSGSNVKCDLKLASDLHPVEVDAGQLGQVVRNLIINAREAMPGGGTITVRAENVSLSQLAVQGLSAGDYVQVTVSDTGHGIPTHLLPNIFDPYFSTKDRGVQKGMGLGLTICHSIIKQHQGVITVESTATGSNFRFYLPVHHQAALPSKPPPPPSHPGTGKILVMDDEPSIVDTVTRTLQSMGYTAEAATDGQAAVDRYTAAQAAGRPFNAVLLDLTVRGGMGGLEAMQALRKKHPAVNAIVMSGYANATELRDFTQHGFKAALRKPFTISELRQALAQVLAS